MEFLSKNSGQVASSFLNAVGRAFLDGYKTSMRNEYIYGDPEYSFRNHPLSKRHISVDIQNSLVLCSYNPTVLKILFVQIAAVLLGG